MIGGSGRDAKGRWKRTHPQWLYTHFSTPEPQRVIYAQHEQGSFFRRTPLRTSYRMHLPETNHNTALKCLIFVVCFMCYNAKKKRKKTYH